MPDQGGRRDFLKQAGAIGALPLLNVTGGRSLAKSGDAKDSSIIFWLAHSMVMAPHKDEVANEKFITDIVAKCADHGFGTVYVVPRYVGKALYYSKVVAPFDTMYGGEGQILLDGLGHYDPYDVAVREAKRRGLKVIAQTSLFDLYFPGLEDRFYERHPQFLMVDRKEQRLYYPGVPCYAEPGAQEYCLSEIKELIERGAEGISFEMDSHQIGWWPPGFGPPRPDSFGFNRPMVEEFQRRYGVNVVKEDFDKETWYALHGEFFTKFLWRVKAELKDKLLIVGMPPEGFLAYGTQPYWHGTLGYFAQAPAVRINLPAYLTTGSRADAEG